MSITDKVNYRVVEVPAGGGAATAIDPVVNGKGLYVPTGVALDGAGDLFIVDSWNNRVVEVPAGGGAAIAIDPTVNGAGLDFPDDGRKDRVLREGARNSGASDQRNARTRHRLDWRCADRLFFEGERTERE